MIIECRLKFGWFKITIIFNYVFVGIGMVGRIDYDLVYCGSFVCV